MIIRTGCLASPIIEASSASPARRRLARRRLEDRRDWRLTWDCHQAINREDFKARFLMSISVGDEQIDSPVRRSSTFFDFQLRFLIKKIFSNFIRRPSCFDRLKMSKGERSLLVSCKTSLGIKGNVLSLRYSVYTEKRVSYVSHVDGRTTLAVMRGALANRAVGAEKAIKRTCINNLLGSNWRRRGVSGNFSSFYWNGRNIFSMPVDWKRVVTPSRRINWPIGLTPESYLKNL